MKLLEKSINTNVIFPKNYNTNSNFHKIVLKSESTLEEFTFEDIEDNKTLNDYYFFTLDLTEIPDGEYVYTIDEIAAKGLLILGNRKSQVNAIIVDNEQKYIVYGE